MKSKMNFIKDHVPINLSADSFYANISKTPIYDAFSQKSGVHAGDMGMPITNVDYNDIWRQAIESKNKEKDTVIYIHTPFCTSRCLFCPFYTYKSSTLQTTEYVKALVKEIELSKNIESPIRAMYFGGGTPTDLEIPEFKAIFKALRENFIFANDCEITIEGRVNGLTREKTDILTLLGANRFSLGVQSFNTDIRRVIGRVCSRDEVLRKLEMLTKYNTASVVIDLIYGLPKQSIEHWLSDIETIFKETNLSGVDLYQLNILKGTPLYDQAVKNIGFKAATIKEQADYFIAGNNLMVENYARRDSLRHYSFDIRERGIYNNLSKYGADCIQLGSGAGGNLGNFKMFNTRDLDEYYAKIYKGEKPLKFISRKSKHAEMFATITGLLEEKRALNLNEIGLKFGVANLFGIYFPLLDQWEKAEVINIKHSGWIELTKAGEFWNVNVAQNLINYFKWVQNEHI